MRVGIRNKIFFERGNIRITGTRFDTGGESFAIKKINGVRIESGQRHVRIGIALVLVGLPSLFGGMLGNVPVLIVGGAALTVGGAMLFFARVNSTVVLALRGRDVKALTSKDSVLIQAVAAALHDAIEGRS